MARQQGTYKLASNIEPRAAAPLDAREKVALKNDLTATGTFPYPYEGMEVYVVEEKKKYILIGDDPTVAGNWQEVGSSGSETLAGLDDTSIESPENNQVLSYDKRTDKWVNKLSEAENVVYKKIPGSEWLPKTWTGLTASYGAYIWTDGENIYYSWKNDHYILDKETSTWVEKTWTGLTEFYGNSIWSDGNNMYYSNGSNQYILDKSTSTWSSKTWTGLTEFWGPNIWSDGNNIYCSAGSDQYVLDKSTSIWLPKTWTGLTEFNGEGIWSDGNNIYLSNGPIQYVLDKETSTWVEKTWTGLTKFNGKEIWSDGENIYRSYNSNHYVLDKSTSTWSLKTWTGLTEFYGSNIWSDGNNNIYHSNGNDQYILDLVNINVKEVIDDIDTKMINIFIGTQAEWDALSTTEKLTYGQVNITDDDAGENLDYYSTTETKTNKVWIDGKPIYRKVYPVTITEPISVTEIAITLDTTINKNNAKLISYGGYLEPGTSGDNYMKEIPYIYRVNTGDYASISCAIGSSGILMVYTYVNPGNTGYIWVEYIKTTD